PGRWSLPLYATPTRGQGRGARGRAGDPPGPRLTPRGQVATSSVRFQPRASPAVALGSGDRLRRPQSWGAAIGFASRSGGERLGFAGRIAGGAAAAPSPG